jgi:Ca-activated chloride channel family protein
MLRDRAPEEANGPDLLARLCSRAGGRYFQVENQRDLAATSDQIAREMRSQYMLGYAPSNPASDGLFRHVVLKLSPAGGRLSIYWRRGYRALAQ